jgi:tetratricopeptide (TPR) repeat protein
VAQAQPPPEGSRYHNPFDALGSRFLVEREGSRVRHRRTRLDPDGRPAAELAWEVHYALGSGTHGYSYLTDRGGYLYETPISWYSQKEVWDLSPGFGMSQLTGRAIVPECLFCHANRAHHVTGSVNRYTGPVFDGYAIGCQRCHGPGELHVASRARAEPVTEPVDYTIVNPRWLEPSLRDAVCEQCHLQGESRVLHRGRELDDFRPGLPAELFWSEFVRLPEAGEVPKAVGHVEQMYESRCFQAGEGTRRLGCVSCHDPHKRVPPAQRVAYYRGRCLSCHQQQGCNLSASERLRRSPEDSCIDCHMPRYGSSDIPHTASTDHRILRGGARHEQSSPPPVPRAPRAAPGDSRSLVSFYRGRRGVDEAEAERDRAIALVNRALEGNVSAAAVLGKALAVLETVVERDADDLPAGEARGYALALRRRGAEALAAFQSVLAKAAERERALLGAAAAAEELRETEAAQGYWRRAIAVNPWAPGYHRNLALLLVKQEAWAEAEAVCQVWLRLDPMSTEARATRVRCLLAAGNKDEARKEFARIEALAPGNLHELRIRFEKKLK